ncbi:unnamed protein product [Adineta ricciae]|uniref:Microbial-type PARG catalytic domain-containing protein n=1 Tax=Adineta ricciae TaxID=249248 RepID=A0A814ARX7_ADIRI|nr:unnamed protein product [Adineta ricciae]
MSLMIVGRKNDDQIGEFHHFYETDERTVVLSKRNNKKNGPIAAPFGLQIPSALRDPTDVSFSEIELMRMSNDDQARDFALGHIHDHEQFAALWNSTRLRPNTRRWMRKVVQIQTINAIYNHFYRLPNGTKIHLDKQRMAQAARITRRYRNDHIYNIDSQLQFSSTIFVVNGDCLDVALCFKTRFPHSNPVVLNMASKNKPGGGWKNGAGAQEENLHRRTNLCQCLEDPYHEFDSVRSENYYVPEFGGMYSPGVSVFRGSETNGYPFFPDGPKYLSFISCAAYSDPPTETDSDGKLKLCGKNIIENTKKKMSAICSMALENRHDILVLSAMGCGVFKNPPNHMAQLFQEVISRDYHTSFKYIVFAIIDDHNSHKSHNADGNVQPFADVFKVPALSLDELQQTLSQLND